MRLGVNIDHIATIREQLEGKKTPTMNEEEAGKKAAGVGKPTDGESPTLAKKGDKKKEGEGECVADKPGNVTNESKYQKASGTAGAGSKGNPVNETGAKLVFSTRDPRSLNESVGLVQRLSATAK